MVLDQFVKTIVEPTWEQSLRRAQESWKSTAETLFYVVFFENIEKYYLKTKTIYLNTW